MEFCVLTSFVSYLEKPLLRVRDVYSTCLSSSICLTLIPENFRGSRTNSVLICEDMIGSLIILCRIVSPLHAEPQDRSTANQGRRRR